MDYFGEIDMIPPSDLQRVDHWKIRTRTLAFGRLPLVMGIVNVTPDSFSDGGRYFDADAAVEHGLQLAAAGADILDIGGESTRPNSEPVDAEEEIRRIRPVVEALYRQTGLPISIDTTKALVARHAMDAGVEIINDITALSGDPAMLPLAAETGCGVCVMHMQGTPKTMQNAPVYADVVAEVTAYLRDRRDILMNTGIAQERIAVDPGIGFGKTAEHNVQLLANAWRLHALGCPVLIAHSRKRFIAETSRVASLSQTPHLSSVDINLDRLGGTIGVALAMARQGVQMVRVHDVAAVRRALSLFDAAGGLDSDPN
jgi:dihydropteroate synthase